jgi:hypothetical protein
MKTNSRNPQLPGEELVRRGVADLQAGRRSVAACLVQVARARLSRAGLIRAADAKTNADAELQLYRLLREEGGDAYSRYNALIRELVSFENALDRPKRTNSET